MALFAKREAIVVSVVWICSVRETGSDEKLSGRGVWQSEDASRVGNGRVSEKHPPINKIILDQ